MSTATSSRGRDAFATSAAKTTPVRPPRLYCHDTDDPDSSPVWEAGNIVGRPPDMVRADEVVEAAFKQVTLPFDETSHRRLRGYIKRLDLPAHRLARLLSLLAWHDQRHATRRVIMGGGLPADDEEHPQYRCNYGFYRCVLFYAYRAALSVLIETAPRSRADAFDMMHILQRWPGALPKTMQARVSKVMGEHLADAIMARPFRYRSLVRKRL